MNMLRSTGTPEQTSATPASGAKWRRYSVKETSRISPTQSERRVGGAMGERYYNRSMPALRGSPADYRQHLEVETPEHVVLDLEIAGIGSRTLAAVLDHLILFGATAALVITFVSLGGFGVARLG